jgi:hypothetical protein
MNDTEKIEERRNQINQRLRELDKLITNPSAYRVNVFEVKQYEEEYNKLIEELNNLPIEERDSRREFYLKTVWYYESENEDTKLVYNEKTDSWRIIRSGEGRPVEVIIENGKVVGFKEQVISSETFGRPVIFKTRVHIDEQKPSNVLPSKPIKFPTIKFCEQCGTPVYEKMVQCPHCGYNFETKKSIATIGNQPIDKPVPRNSMWNFLHNKKKEKK